MNNFDKHIPIPAKWTTARNIFGLQGMNVGDSKFLAGITSAGSTTARSNAKALNGGTYTVRTEINNGVSGIRIWRIT